MTKPALVTGGAGFIGSHLVETLLARGQKVVVLDDESTGRRQNLAAVLDHPHLEFVAGDAGNGDLIRELVARTEAVYHLAAAVGVALIAEQPFETIERNIHPTHLLLSELVAQHNAGEPKKFFLASSSEVYGKNPKSQWTEEDDLLFGPTSRARWSYGASKAIDEFLALACAREHGLPTVVGRFFNVVGPRQTGQYGMVLPRFVAAALTGRSPVVHDDGKQERCFAHVRDVVGAVVQLMETPQAAGGVFNIGSDEPVSILDLARMVTAAVDPAIEVEFESYAEAYSEDFEDVRRRVPDLAKLRATIDFLPEFDLAGIIDSVVQWQRQTADRS